MFPFSPSLRNFPNSCTFGSTIIFGFSAKPYASPRNLTVIALWDGEPDDGPGGTEPMVSLANERGARIIHLDTKALFGLT
jgi:hypothetical protein